MTDLERAKEALTTIDCTCALCRDGEVRTTQLRGVAPLLSWLEEGLSLRCARAKYSLLRRLSRGPGGTLFL